MPTRPASGWYVTVTGSGGYVHEAPVVTGEGRSVSFQPRANSRPGIRVPVRKSDKWQTILGDGSTNIGMDVFHEGVRVAADTLDKVKQAPGATILIGSGGRELETRIEDFIDQKAVHTAAQDYIDNNTAYTSNVDTPQTTTETNTTLATLTSNADFNAQLARPPLATEPWEVSGGSVKLLQTCFTVEGEDWDRNSGVDRFEDSRFSGDGTSSGDGAAARFDSNSESAEWDFTPPYTIPKEDLEILVRRDMNNSPAIDATLNGVTWEVMSDGGTFGSVVWDDIADGSEGGVTDGYTGGDLEGGTTYTLRLESTSSGGTSPAHYVDVVAPRDGGGDRFTPNYNDDNTPETNSNNNRALDGPEKFPDGVEVRFAIVAAPEAVTGIRAEGTISNGASDYTHYVSNDQGANFTTGTGANLETDSLGTAFGPGITYKAGLSRTGTQQPTPQEGIAGTDLQALTLKADLSDMPIVVNTPFDGPLDTVLTQLANLGDQLWAYERDGSTESIEWTTPGQRTSSKTPQITDFETDKSTADVYQKAAVYGRPDVPVRDEQFESNHGVAVSLLNDRLQQGTERVFDPDTAERFTRNQDYTINYQAGEITVLASGDMADSSTFEIDYEYQPFGEFDDGTPSPKTIDVNVPGLTTDFACAQAAQIIVNEVNTPLHTATVTIPSDDTAWSVVESLDPPIVPTGGNALHVKEVVNTPEQTVLTLGSRRSLDDVVADIRTQVSAVSRPA